MGPLVPTFFLMRMGDGDLDLYVVALFGHIVWKTEPHCERVEHSHVLRSGLFLRGAPDLLYRNEGNGLFTDVSFEAGCGGFLRAKGLGVVEFWITMGMGDTDLYVANDTTPNFFVPQTWGGRF